MDDRRKSTLGTWPWLVAGGCLNTLAWVAVEYYPVEMSVTCSIATTWDSDRKNEIIIHRLPRWGPIDARKIYHSTIGSNMLFFSTSKYYYHALHYNVWYLGHLAIEDTVSVIGRITITYNTGPMV